MSDPTQSEPGELLQLRIPSRRPPHHTIGVEILDQAWRAWSDLREGSALPKRAALDPAAMAPVLGHAMILDHVRHGAVRIRLGGQALHAMMGMDVRGLPVRAFFDLADRGPVVDLIEKAFKLPATLELDLIARTAAGLVTARMIVLPLLDAKGLPSKALAVLVADRPDRALGCRFELTNSFLVPVRGDQATAASDRPLRRRTDWALPVETRVEMAEGAADYTPPARLLPTSVPWLRLVK